MGILFGREPGEVNLDKICESVNLSCEESNKEISKIIESLISEDYEIGKSFYSGTIESSEAQALTESLLKDAKEKIKASNKKVVDSLKNLQSKFETFIKQFSEKDALKIYGEDFFKDMQFIKENDNFRITIKTCAINDIQIVIEDLMDMESYVNNAIEYFKHPDANKSREVFVPENLIKKCERLLTPSTRNVLVDQQNIDVWVGDLKNKDKIIKDFNDFSYKTIAKLENLSTQISEDIDTDAIKNLNTLITACITLETMSMSAMKNWMETMNKLLIGAAKREKKYK